MRIYQHGVPTKVFLTRCLSPESNKQAETPKSPSLIAPWSLIRMFPAYAKTTKKYDHIKQNIQFGI